MLWGCWIPLRGVGGSSLSPLWPIVIETFLFWASSKYATIIHVLKRKLGLSPINASFRDRLHGRWSAHGHGDNVSILFWLPCFVLLRKSTELTQATTFRTSRQHLCPEPSSPMWVPVKVLILVWATCLAYHCNNSESIKYKKKDWLWSRD